MAPYLFYATVVLTLWAARWLRGSWTYFLVVAPGTLAHELAHYVVAIATGSRPAPISLIPKREGDYWVLGSVSFVPGAFTAGLVALAPLYLLPLGMVWLHHTGLSSTDVSTAVYGYLFALLLQGMWPSGQDWSVAFSYPISTLVVLTVLVSVGLSLAARIATLM